MHIKINLGTIIKGCLSYLVFSSLPQSKSLEDYYKTKSKLVDIQVTDAPGETWQGLLAALQLQHINAVSTSQKLTA